MPQVFSPDTFLITRFPEVIKNAKVRRGGQVKLFFASDFTDNKYTEALHGVRSFIYLGSSLPVLKALRFAQSPGTTIPNVYKYTPSLTFRGRPPKSQTPLAHRTPFIKLEKCGSATSYSGLTH